MMRPCNDAVNVVPLMAYLETFDNKYALMKLENADMAYDDPYLHPWNFKMGQIIFFHLFPNFVY